MNTKDELDGYVGTAEFARLLDCSRRTFWARVKTGVIPAPENPAQRLGEGHKWRRSTVRAVLDAISRPTKVD
jgi:hypothetical protein